MSPPPIPFVSKAKKVEKADGAEVDKTESIKMEFFMDSANPASKYAGHFVIFKDGCPEDWIKWLMAFRDIENLMPFKEPADKTKMSQTLLKGHAFALCGLLRRKGSIINEV